MIYCEVIYCGWLFTRSKQCLSLHRGKRSRFVTVLQDQFCLKIGVNLWGKKGKQTFSKIVGTRELTRQRTLQIDNAHVDRNRYWQHLQEETKILLIHGELTEANKALCFFSEGVVIQILDVFFHTIDAKTHKRLPLRFAMSENTGKIQLLRIYCLRLHIHARLIRPSIKLIFLLMVSFLILLRSLRVYKIKQLFTSGSVNVVENLYICINYLYLFF